MDKDVVRFTDQGTGEVVEFEANPKIEALMEGALIEGMRRRNDRVEIIKMEVEMIKMKLGELARLSPKYWVVHVAKTVWRSGSFLMGELVPPLKRRRLNKWIRLREEKMER